MRLKYPQANISNFHLSRKEKGGEALMTIELDVGRGSQQGERGASAGESDMAKDIRGLSNVINAIVIRAI
jgi:L-serine dehydratase